MTEQEFNQGIQEAKRKINELPAEQQPLLMKTLKEVMRRHAAIKANADKARSGIEDLRVMLKYLVFDFEATKRERDELRKRLDDLGDEA